MLDIWIENSFHKSLSVFIANFSDINDYKLLKYQIVTI